MNIIPAFSCRSNIQQFFRLAVLATILTIKCPFTFGGYDGLGGFGGFGGFGGWGWDPWGLFGGGGYTSPFNYTLNADNTATITGATFSAGALDIPNQINGYTVSAIAPNAFSNLQISSATIPSTVRSIGDSAFSSCSLLTTITLNSGLASIGSFAFSGCASLVTIELPNTLIRIGEGAFNGSGLTSIVVPGSVQSISRSAFTGCSQLTAVYFEGANPLTDQATFPGSTTVYYLADTFGWLPAIAGHVTTVWTPRLELVQNAASTASAELSFNIRWSGNRNVVIETCDDLNSRIWEPLATTTLNKGVYQFRDSSQSAFPSRIYRVRSL